MTATSNSIGGGSGIAAETPDGLGVGSRFTLLTTNTSAGALPCSSFRPSCRSIIAKMVMPSAPARCSAWNGVNATSKSQ
jgi:hypothetical protein